MVDAVLGEAGVSLSQLDGIAAGVGPGAFTGVRISVAVAQGLAFGAGLPVVPVTTLEALACHAIGAGADRVLACLDARMGEVYWGCFAADRGARRARSRAALQVDRGRGGVRWPSAARYRGIGRGFAAYPVLARASRRRGRSARRAALPNARESRASARCGSRRAGARSRRPQAAICARQGGADRSGAVAPRNSTSHGTVTCRRCNSAAKESRD